MRFPLRRLVVPVVLDMEVGTTFTVSELVAQVNHPDVTVQGVRKLLAWMVREGWLTSEYDGVRNTYTRIKHGKER